MFTAALPRFSPRLKYNLRGLLRTSLLGLCRLRSRAYLPDAGIMLVIAPHQDDCALGCGGLILKKRLVGQPVEILYLTDGAASHLGHPLLSPAQVSTLRKGEARLANQRLGVDSAALHFLDLPDGRLDQLESHERNAAVTRLASVLSECAPSTLLLPLRHDGSSEHEAGRQLVRDALDRTLLRPRVLEYPVWSLWRPQLLLPALYGAHVHQFHFPGYSTSKSHALAAYSSQFEPTAPWTRAVLPAGFRLIFKAEREFFFEYPS
jgi:LmbE family N-acetylglucosaminyl deacetylase